MITYQKRYFIALVFLEHKNFAIYPELPEICFFRAKGIPARIAFSIRIMLLHFSFLFKGERIFKKKNVRMLKFNVFFFFIQGAQKDILNVLVIF